jgi:hypothetical protein
MWKKPGPETKVAQDELEEKMDQMASEFDKMKCARVAEPRRLLLRHPLTGSVS